MLSIVNVIIGVVIGAAVVWLLLVPSVRRNLALEYNQAVVEYGSLISENNNLIASYEKENADLTAQNQALQDQLDSGGRLTDADSSEENLFRRSRHISAVRKATAKPANIWRMWMRTAFPTITPGIYIRQFMRPPGRRLRLSLPRMG